MLVGVLVVVVFPSDMDRETCIYIFSYIKYLSVHAKLLK